MQSPKKVRPLVDPRVYALAEEWAGEFRIEAETADAASDLLQDAIWDLAAALQHSIEGWTEDALIGGRLLMALPRVGD